MAWRMYALYRVPSSIVYVSCILYIFVLLFVTKQSSFVTMHVCWFTCMTVLMFLL